MKFSEPSLFLMALKFQNLFCAHIMLSLCHFLTGTSVIASLSLERNCISVDISGMRFIHSKIRCIKELSTNPSTNPKYEEYEEDDPRYQEDTHRNEEDTQRNEEDGQRNASSLAESQQHNNETDQLT